MTTENVKVITKKAKKVNVKEVAKAEVMAMITDALIANGVEFKDGSEYGMTKGTIIVDHNGLDIQIKPINTKANTERYPIVEIEE